MKEKKSLEERIENGYIRLFSSVVKDMESNYKYTLKEEFILDNITFKEIEEFIISRPTNVTKNTVALTVKENIFIELTIQNTGFISYIKNNFDHLKRNYKSE